MARSAKKVGAVSGGPYLQAAFLCERVLQEVDGAITAVRIVDKFTAQQPAAMSLPILPVVGGSLLISFKSSGRHGVLTLRLAVCDPSDIELQSMEMPMALPEVSSGVNLIIPFEFYPPGEGRYWIDVIVERRRVTRIPVEVSVEVIQEDGPLPTSELGV